VLVASVAVTVFEPGDPPQSGSLWISNHLGHIQPLRGIPRQRHWAAHRRFTGHELHFQTGIFQHKLANFVRRRKR
jgi:hypothetical protein